MKKRDRFLTAICVCVIVSFLLLGLSIVLDIMGILDMDAEGSTAMFCNGRIVDEGDPEVELFMKCGSPTYSSNCDEDYDLKSNRVRRACVVTHYYERGSQQFVKAVTVKSGRVIDIEDLDYGD